MELSNTSNDNAINLNNRISNANNAYNNNHSCNFRERSQCPLLGHCLVGNVIYKCLVMTEANDIIFFGSSINMKKSLNNCFSSFKLRHKASSTLLSTKIWEPKESDIKFSLKWDIVIRSQSYAYSQYECELCCMRLH